MAALGYQLPGTRITERTAPSTSNLTSAFRLLSVIGEFNSKIRVENETVIKSNPLLGTSYNSFHFSPSDTITAFFPVNNTTYWVGTAFGGLQLTRDGGLTFTNISTANSTLPSDQIKAIFYDSGFSYIATVSGLAITSDFGATFTVLSTPTLPSATINDVWAQGASIYVATANGFSVSEDGGLSFNSFNQSGQLEITQVVVPADTSVSLQNKYFTINSPTTAYYVWYNVGGGGVDPAPGGTGIEVDIISGATANDIAVSAALAINTLQGSVFTASALGAVITVTNDIGGAATDATLGTTGWSGISISQGSNAIAQVTAVTLPADTTFTLQNKYFTIHSPSTSYYVWYNVGGAGVDPAPGGTGIMVALTADDDSATVAAATVSAINTAFPLVFLASNVGTSLTITNLVEGVATDATSGTTTWSSPSIIQGVNGVAEINNLDLATLTGASFTASGDGDYFTFQSQSGVDFYVWYDLGSNLDPSPIVGAIGIHVSILAGDAAAALITKTDTALGLNATFTANFSTTNNGTDLNITNLNTGVPASGPNTATLPSPGAITVTTAGVDAIAESELFIVVGNTKDLPGSYWRLDSPTVGYYVWYNAGAGTGSTDPAALNPGRTAIQVNFSLGDSATTVAIATAAAINALVAFIVPVPGTPTITITNAVAGAAAAPVDGTTGISSITVSIPGANAVKEVTNITAQADVIGLGGKYWLLNSPSTAYYVWYNVNSSSIDPALSGKTSIMVPLTAGDNSTAVGVVTASTINALSDFSSSNIANAVTITNAAIGSSADAQNVTAGVVVSILQQGFLGGLLNNNIACVFVTGDDVYLGSINGINISNDNGMTWTSTWTTSNGLTSNNTKDIIVVNGAAYIANASGLDISTDLSTFTQSTGVTASPSQIAVSGLYVYAATNAGLFVSINAGTSYFLRTSANGLNSTDTNTVYVNGSVLYVGGFAGLNTTISTDSVVNTATGGVNILRIGSRAEMDNFRLDRDYTFTSSGVINWLNTSTNLPVIGSNVFVKYEYNRPLADFNKSYIYESYDDFVADWQNASSDFIGNVFVYVALQVIGLSRISIVPVRPTVLDVDFTDGLDVIKERNVQDVVVLSTSETVQVQAAFHVQERSAPENAFYRMYWTGGPSNYPLGDVDSPSSLIGRKSLLTHRRVVFINAPRGEVEFKTDGGGQDTTQVDGSFMSGIIVAFYNSQPNANPNVEVMGKIIPGFTLFNADFDDFYSNSKLTQAGQASLYLMTPSGTLGVPRVVDDLTTDSSTIERQNPNIIRSADYVNTNVANLMVTTYQGKLIVDRSQLFTNINNSLRKLFQQFKANQVIADFSGIKSSLSPIRADTVIIKYAFEAIYTHKYTEGEYFLSIPTT